MRDKYFYEIMFDDTSIDVSKEVGLVWSIANSLRGAYTSDKYKDVIIPMVIIRRFECALEATKDAVVAKHKQNPSLPAALLCQVSKYPFYNYSEYTLKRLLDDSDSIASNLKSYIEGFSANIQLILEKLLKFSTQIDKMDKSNRLYSVVKKFSDLDLYPAHVDSMKMGYIFEDMPSGTPGSRTSSVSVWGTGSAFCRSSGKAAWEPPQGCGSLPSHRRGRGIDNML